MPAANGPLLTLQAPQITRWPLIKQPRLYAPFLASDLVEPSSKREQRFRTNIQRAQEELPRDPVPAIRMWLNISPSSGTAWCDDGGWGWRWWGGGLTRADWATASPVFSVCVLINRYNNLWSWVNFKVLTLCGSNCYLSYEKAGTAALTSASLRAVRCWLMRVMEDNDTTNRINESSWSHSFCERTNGGEIRSAPMRYVEPYRACQQKKKKKKKSNETDTQKQIIEADTSRVDTKFQARW